MSIHDLTFSSRLDDLPGLFSWGVLLVGGDDVLEDLLWESVVFCCPVTFKFIIYLYIS